VSNIPTRPQPPPTQTELNPDLVGEFQTTFFSWLCYFLAAELLAKDIHDLQTPGEVAHDQDG
jgi:hypothetical protein